MRQKVESLLTLLWIFGVVAVVVWAADALLTDIALTEKILKPWSK